MLLEPNESARIDYFFKNYTNTFLLPNQPNAVTVNQQTVHEHFYSIDGTPLSRRSNKVHWTISIEGFSGVAKRNFVDINGVKTLASIEKILQSFEEFLQKYREDGRSIDFFDLQKGKHYRDAFPVAFTYNSSVSGSRLGYTWQLELVCYSEVKKQFKATIKLGHEKFFADLTETVDNYTSGATTITNRINNISDAVNRPVRELLNSTSRALTSTLDIVQSTRGGIQATRNTLRRSIETIYDAVNTAQNFTAETIELFTQDLGSFFAYSEIKNGNADVQATFKSLGLTESKSAIELEEAIYRLGILVGNFGVYNTQFKNSLKIRASGGSFLDTENSLALLSTFNDLGNEISTNDQTEESKYKYILRAGENLYRVAVRVYNDVNQWYLIAELNGWLDANTTASGYPPSAGDTIFLPSDPSQLGVSAIPNIVGNGDVLLTDIALIDGDLQLINGDLRLFSGEDNFIQAVTNKLRTFQGELVDDPNYGFPDVIGTTTRNEFLSLQVISQLLQDPRVLRVSDVTLQQEKDSIFLDVNVTPFQGDSLNIIVPIGD